MSYSDASDFSKTVQHWNAVTPAKWRLHRLIALGYYDGPTEGLVDLGPDVGVYCFKMMAMDSEQESRALRLILLPEASFDEIAITISGILGTPNWPVWVPVWEFTNDDVRVELESRIERVCSSGTTVAAALCNDTLEKCFSARELDEATAGRVTDWMSFAKGD